MSEKPAYKPWSDLPPRKIETELTLRDRFAMAALIGLLQIQDHDPTKATAPEYFSKWSYEYADAMLAQRGKK